MENYSLLRQIADSWGLLAMFVFFVGVILWILRPGATTEHRDSADMIFRNENSPAGGKAAGNNEGAAR